MSRKLLQLLTRNWRNCLVLAGISALAGAGPAKAQAPATPTWSWVQPVGGGVGNQATCYGTATDAAGNTYVGGAFEGVGHFGALTLTSSPQSSQPYVAQLNAAGTYQWVTSVAGYGRGSVQGIATDAAGNVYVTGNFDGTLTFGATTLSAGLGTTNAFVAKLSPTGTWLWAASGGGYTRDVGRALVVRGGTVFVTGQVHDQARFGNTPVLSATTTGFADIFVAALDAATGTWQWSRCAAGTNTNPNNYGFAIGLNAAGDVYIAGNFTQQAAFGSTTLAATSADIYLAKLSAAGTWLWASKAGGTSTNSCPAMTVDAAGNAYLTGSCSGPATFGSTVLLGNGRGYVAKANATGVWLWARQTTGTSGIVFGKGIAFDEASQRVYINGNFSGSQSFGGQTLQASGPFDVYVASLDAAGTWQWVVPATGPDRVVANTLSLGAGGALYTVGYTVGNATFGAAALAHPNPPAEQPYVARLSASVVTATAARQAAGAAALWPCPAGAAQLVQVRWASGQQPQALAVCDALGREVYRQPLTAAALETTFPAPSQPGWYQCRLLLPAGGYAVARLVVAP